MQRNLTRIFIILESVSHGLPKFETEFLGKLWNSNVFSAQKQVVSKKKKSLHRNWVWFFGQNRKFKQFFSPQTSGLQNKKKSLHRNWVWFLGQNRKFRHFFTPNHDIYNSTSQLRHPISFGGTVFNFSPKIGLKKQQKRAILHTSQAKNSKFFKRDQVEVHFFLEPVNLESILAVFIFCRFSASFALDFVKILRASMSILAAKFVTRFNSYCTVCFKWKLSPLLLRHRKFANEKKQAFFQVELPTNFLNCLRRATALYIILE